MGHQRGNLMFTLCNFFFGKKKTQSMKYLVILKLKETIESSQFFWVPIRVAVKPSNPSTTVNLNTLFRC